MATITLTNLVPCDGKTYFDVSTKSNMSSWATSTKHPDDGSTGSTKITPAASGEATLASKVTPSLDPTHKYYISFQVMSETAMTASFDWYWPIAEPPAARLSTSLSANTWVKLSAVFERASFSAGAYQCRWDYNNESSLTPVYLSSTMLIDLTAAFGAGSEPNKEWMDANITFADSQTVEYSGNIVWAPPDGWAEETGAHVSFKSPFDSVFSGKLQIGSNEYAIVDACGETANGKSGAFVSGAVVDLILDCESKKAYLQNSAVGGTGDVDLSGYAKTSDIPTKTSQLTNDSGFLTEHQSLADYAKTADIPTKTSQLTNDSGFLTSHQDISSKQDKSTLEADVAAKGFTKNTGTYSKPSTGIPKSDLASDVQTSLGKADTALQSYTETDPTVPAWAKANAKPSYTADEVGALPITGGTLAGNLSIGSGHTLSVADAVQFNAYNSTTSASLSLGGHYENGVGYLQEVELRNLATPTTDLSAANKAYVDAQVSSAVTSGVVKYETVRYFTSQGMSLSWSAFGSDVSYTTFTNIFANHTPYDITVEDAEEGTITRLVFDCWSGSVLYGHFFVNDEMRYFKADSTGISEISVSRYRLISDSYSKSETDTLLASAGKVKTVNGVEPDANGNITISTAGGTQITDDGSGNITITCMAADVTATDDGSGNITLGGA